VDQSPPATDELLSHAKFVRGLARALLGDEQRADDAVQETYLTALAHPPDRVRPLRPWLAAVLRNMVRRDWRQRRRRERREQAAARPETQPSFVGRLEREEALPRVVEGVLALDVPYREVVLLHYYEGISYAEVAERLSVPLETVRSRLKRARAILRSRLGDRRHWSPALAALVGSDVAAARIYATAGRVLMGAKAKWAMILCAVAMLLAFGLWRLVTDGSTSEVARAGERAGSSVALEAGSHGPMEVPSAPQPVATEARQDAVRGTVVEATTHEPVEGALVMAVDPGDTWLVAPHGTPSTRTDGGGRFVAPIHGNQRSILVVADEYLPALQSIRTQGDNVVTLRRGLTVSGRVVDGMGSPVAGARVWATLETNRVAWPNTRHFLLLSDTAAGAEGVTDSAGYYELRGLTPDTRYALRCSKKEYSFPQWRNPPVEYAGQGQIGDLVLRGVCRLAARAVDADSGEAVPNAECRLVYQLRDVKPPIDYQCGDAATSEAPEGGFLPEGWVRVTLARTNPGVPDDRFTAKVCCSAPGYGAELKELALSEGTVTAEIPMHRSGTQAWGGVRFGFRFRTSGIPFSGELLVRIWAEDDTAGNARVRVVDGQAQGLVKLPLGRYRFTIRGFGSAGSWWLNAGRVNLCEVTSDETPCNVELDGTPVLLTVRDQEGRLVRGYDIQFKLGDGLEGGQPRWDVPTNHSLSRRPREVASFVPDLYVPSGSTSILLRYPELGSCTAEWIASGDGVVKHINAVLVPDRQR